MIKKWFFIAFAFLQIGALKAGVIDDSVALKVAPIHDLAALFPEEMREKIVSSWNADQTICLEQDEFSDMPNGFIEKLQPLLPEVRYFNLIRYGIKSLDFSACLKLLGAEIRFCGDVDITLPKHLYSIEHYFFDSSSWWWWKCYVTKLYETLWRYNPSYVKFISLFKKEEQEEITCQFFSGERGYRLILSNKKLPNDFWEALSPLLPYLRELWLDNCGLTSLPKVIGMAYNLKVLHIEHNPFVCLPVELAMFSSKYCTTEIFHNARYYNLEGGKFWDLLRKRNLVVVPDKLFEQ